MIITLAFKFKESKRVSFWDSVLNKLIKIWTKSDYYHVEMIVNDTWITSSPSHGGVTLEPLQPLKDNYVYIDVNIDGRKISKLNKFLEEITDAEYDWDGIFLTQFLNTSTQDPNKWFCSELVAQILIILGEDLEAPSSYSPGDLFRIYGS